MDYLWIKEVLDFCKKTNISIITGMILKEYNDNNITKIINNLYYFIPYNDGFKNKVFIGKREKNDYSPEEEKYFHELNLKYNTKPREYHLIKKDNFVYTPILCYEFTNPESRYVFNGVVHGVFVSELNHDTNYFSSIIHTTSRELHAYVIQANSSLYGDTRVTSPLSTVKMNLVSVKGGQNTTLHYVKLDIDGLLKSENFFFDCKLSGTLSDYKSDFKAPSAGFKRISFKDFINKINRK